jgi:hypothetical protein
LDLNIALSWRSPGRSLAFAWASLSLIACARVQRPILPEVIPSGARVRVTAPELPPGWHPGRLTYSSERCRIVTVATARHPEPLSLLNMGQIRHLQLSQATPPPDWWTDPQETEGWAEVELARLRAENDRCRSHYPQSVR